MNKELRIAQENFERGQDQLEQAMDHLKVKVEGGASKAVAIVDTFRAPREILKNYPFTTVTLSFLIGFVAGRSVSF